MDKVFRCGCRADCTMVRCSSCKQAISDCKWPGDCAGKCQECGASAEGAGGTCSKACMDAMTQRWKADGSLIAVSEISTAQATEMLGKAGIRVDGPPREPS